VNLRPHRRPPPDINLTPLLDVVFLLLIFFMVSTTFKDEARLRVQLPQAQGEDVPVTDREQIVVVIDRSGAYYVDDQAVVDQSHETLVRAINGALGDRKPIPVLIQADAQTPHQAVMTAMDAAAELGLTRIAFSATRAGTKGPDAKHAKPEGSPAAGSAPARTAPLAGPGLESPIPGQAGAVRDPDAHRSGGADSLPIPPQPETLLAPDARP
jgi:biopolymer transport protein ExbD